MPKSEYPEAKWPRGQSGSGWWARDHVRHMTVFKVVTSLGQQVVERCVLYKNGRGVVKVGSGDEVRELATVTNGVSMSI